VSDEMTESLEGFAVFFTELKVCHSRMLLSGIETKL